MKQRLLILTMLLQATALGVWADGEATAYDLWVGGVQVTSDNAADLSVIETVTGAASYDAATNTLSLNGATITGGYGTDDYGGAIVYLGTTDFSISVTGTNTVTGDTRKEYAMGIMFGDPNDIYNLNTIRSYEITINIAADATLTVYGGNAEGGYYPSSWGICSSSSGKFNISCAGTLNVSPKNATYCFGLSCSGEMTITGGGTINATTPDGVYFGQALGAYALEVNDATINAIAGTAVEQSFGIDTYNGGWKNLGDFVIKAGTVTAVGGTRALNIVPDKPVTLGTDMAAKGSSNIDGSNPIKYVAADNDSYKWFQAFPYFGVPIDEEHFPDAGFRNYVKNGKWLYGYNGNDPMYFTINPDGNDYLSDEEIEALTDLRIQEQNDIRNIQGIEYFTAMEYLDIESCEMLEEMDLSKATQLKLLYISNCPISTLDVSMLTALESFTIDNCPISAIDLSELTELQVFSIGACPNITALDVSKNSKLAQLLCNQNNSLTKLDASGLTNLFELYCTHGALTELIAEGCTSLYRIYAEDNKLQALNVNGCTTLQWIFCQYNQISETSMGDLVESLPVKDDSNPSYLVAIDKYSDTEGNVINNEQVAAAKAKNWKVNSMSGIQDWSSREDYEGSEPTGISNATLSREDGRVQNHDAWYTIDGRKLDAKSTHQGVYIVYGRKIVVK